MASLTQGSTPTPRTFRSRMASAWGTSKRIGAGARDFSKRWVFSGRHHEAGVEWMKFGTGLKRKMPFLGRALGLGFLGYNAVSGYEEGGIWGAAKSVGTDFALNYAFGRLMSTIGAVGAKALGVGAVAGVVGGIGTAAYMGVTGASLQSVLTPLARPAIHDFYKQHAKLEMGAPVLDQFGTLSTMRQRSIMAIQNSRVNGRTALGNEALLMYSSYWK